MEQPPGIQWTFMQKLEDDDVSLLSHTVGHMQAKTTKLCNIGRTEGLDINTYIYIYIHFIDAP